LSHDQEITQAIVITVRFFKKGLRLPCVHLLIIFDYAEFSKSAKNNREASFNFSLAVYLEAL